MPSVYSEFKGCSSSFNPCQPNSTSANNNTPRLRTLDANANKDDTNNNFFEPSIRTLHDYPGGQSSINRANLSPRRVRTRSTNVSSFNRHALGIGAGESPQFLYRSQSPDHYIPDGSSGFLCGYLSSFPHPSPSEEYFDLDDGVEKELFPDETLKFEASQSGKGEIYAEFVREHFKCPICLDVLIEPTMLLCGHRYCRACIATWMSVRRQCPICEKYVSTTMLPQYDLNNAINSVASFLSTEWQKRRQSLMESPQNSEAPTNAFSVSSRTAVWVPSKIELLFKNSHKFLKKNVPIWLRSARHGASLMYNSCTLQSVTKGAMIGGGLMLLFAAAEDISNFLQYMYLVIANYDKRIPITRQIREMASVKVGGKGQTMYQDFEGDSNTIFARFLTNVLLLIEN